jgi:hypothetical protein
MASDTRRYVTHCVANKTIPYLTRLFQMISYLYKKIVSSGWAPADPDPADCMGVLVRKQRGTYITMPTPINDSLLDAAVKLNIIAALTMRPEMLDGILASLMPGQTELRFHDGSQLQILDSIMLVDQSTIKKFQYACVCRQEKLILVWHDDLTNLTPQAAKIEERLLSLVSRLLVGVTLLNDLTIDIPGLGRSKPGFQHPPSTHEACLSQLFSIRRDFWLRHAFARKEGTHDNGPRSGRIGRRLQFHPPPRVA